MKAFRLSLVAILLVCVVLPSVTGTFGPFKGNRNPMHAIHRGMGRMHKMISNMFKKGMKGKKYSRVHKSSDSFFSKILEKPSIVQKKMNPHRNGLHFSMK